MPKGKSVRKLKLFQQGKSNLEQILKCSSKAYCCPICGTFKSIDELTLEHAPPKSMGGKEIILTCKVCNNDAGSKIDLNIAHQQNMNRILKSLASQKFQQTERAKINIGGMDIKVELNKESDDTPLNISILGNCNNPHDIQKVKDYTRVVAESGGSFSFKLQSTDRYNYNERLAKIGHLKTAFLISVAALGYTFAFSKNLREFRRQISTPSFQIVDFYIEYFESTSKADCLLEVPQLGIIAVSFSGVTVLLPHPLRSLDSYSNTLRLIHDGMLPKITGQEITWPEDFNAVIDNSNQFDFQVVDD
ncbi:HNH endonuclease [Aliiglaciecola sp. SL4]|uniref:HNH endonuclease n=1 Tax=Aliiglaciecola sp. SL4 TaxID=3239806 RepID=UPI00355C3276